MNIEIINLKSMIYYLNFMHDYDDYYYDCLVHLYMVNCLKIIVFGL